MQGELNVLSALPVTGLEKMTATGNKVYLDDVNRIEVELEFSLAKRYYSLGLIRTKLDVTSRSSIVLSIIAMNVDRLATFSLIVYLISIFQGTL